MGKRIGSAAAVLGLTAVGMVAATGTAAAASYNGGCGSGYSVIDSKDVGDGNTFLTYNSSTGYNCVVTVSDTPGKPMHLRAALRIHRTDTVWKAAELDEGTYNYYAGPVYLYASHSCIDFGGSANSSYFQVDYGVHCG
ncbi:MULTISPECIES: spore-associated protein A [Streptomyces]|uniref:spore-associated protein A n=1 Tax=Streptomyces TaxID=1883 RepID=UPI001ABEF1B9|nr:spore-associated protein A [Streptomyces griseoluteus]